MSGIDQLTVSDERRILYVGKVEHVQEKRRLHGTANYFEN